MWKCYYIYNQKNKGEIIILRNKIIVGLATVLGALSLGVVGANAATYKVENGDTVSAIAQKFDTNTSSIVSENGLSNPNMIYVGQTLEIGEQQSAQSKQNVSVQPQQTQQVSNQQTYTQPKETQTYSGNSSVSSVAQEMQARTGVSASEWETIIERESGGNVNAQNPSSSAHGLFQSEHNPGNTVQSQINDAVNVYKEQGLSAWSETAY